MSGDGLSEDEIIGLLGELLIVDHLIERDLTTHWFYWVGVAPKAMQRISGLKVFG